MPTQLEPRSQQEAVRAALVSYSFSVSLLTFADDARLDIETILLRSNLKARWNVSQISWISFWQKVLRKGKGRPILRGLRPPVGGRGHITVLYDV